MIVYSNCDEDWLEIHDGPNVSAPLIYGRKLCGDGIPDPKMSSGNEIFIRFRSNARTQSSGYQIKITAGNIEFIYIFFCKLGLF